MDLEYPRTPLSENNSQMPILIMTVDIGEGLKDNIVIYQNSSIEETVQIFSIKHSLTKEQENKLIVQVQSHLYDENSESQEMTRDQYFEYWNHEVDKRLAKIPERRPSINKKSIQLAQNRQSKPVYERLYSLSLKSKPIEIEYTEKPKGTQCGRRLYDSWLTKKQHTEYLRTKALEQKEEEVTKTLTFKPQINSNISVSSGIKQDPQFYKKFKEENLERKRFEKLAKEQETCTFNPQINPNSEFIIQQKFQLRSKNKFEELYEEASIRKEKNEELANQYFESQFNIKPERMSFSVPIQEHIDRLYSSKKVTEEYLQERRKELNQLVDPMTGQEYFKPKIGRPPRDRSDTMSTPKELTQNFTTKLELASRLKNEELLNKKKRARYQEIFNSLNSCNVEKIYSDIVTTDSLDPEVVRIIYPLLQELEETGERLDFEEFYDSLENLCKFLTPEERYILLKEKQKIEVKFESKPRTSSSTGKMYSRSIKYKEESNSKLNAERIKKSDEELKECTFHPKIKKYRRVKQNNYTWLIS